MAFPQRAARIETSIGRILHIIEDSAGGPDTIKFMFFVHDQFGKIMDFVDGDELPHINAPHTANLVAFVAAQRAKAEATLPEPE